MNQQHKTAHGCLQAIAVIVVLFFVMTAVPTTLIVTLTNTLTNRGSFKKAISVESFIREFMVQSIEADVQQSYAALNLPFPGIDRRSIERSVDLAVPADWADDAIHAGIDNIFNFLEDGRTDDYILDVTPLIKSLQSDAGREAMTLIVSQYPPCPTAEVPPIVYAAQNVEIICVPLGMPVAEYAGQIHAVLANGLANDPDLQSNGGVEPIKWTEMDPIVVQDVLEIYDMIDLVWLAWLVPLVLLLIIAALAIRSYYSMGIWLGWPLLLTGIFIPVPAIWVSFKYSELLNATIEGTGVPEDELGRIATFLILNAADTLRNIWLGRVLMLAILMFFLGAGGIFLAFYLKRIRPRRQVDHAAVTFEAS